MSRKPAFPRTPRLRAGARAGTCLGGGRNPPPSFASARASCSPGTRHGVCPGFAGAASRAGQGSPPPARTTPLLVFKIAFVVSLPLLNFCIAIERRRSSKGVDALAEMPEGAKPMRLPRSPASTRRLLPTHARAKSRRLEMHQIETAGLPTFSATPNPSPLLTRKCPHN